MDVRRDGRVGLPRLPHKVGPAGDQCNVAPVRLELVQQLEHRNVRRHKNQRLDIDIADAPAFLRRHHDELLRVDKAPNVVLVFMEDGQPGMAHLEDSVQKVARERVAGLQHHGLRQGPEAFLGAHVRQLHDPMHNLDLVALLDQKCARSEVPGRESDEVIRVPLLARVEPEGARRITADERLAWRSVVESRPDLKLRGLRGIAGRISKRDHGLFCEVVRRCGGNDAELLVVVAFEDGHVRETLRAEVGVDTDDGAKLREVVAALVVLAQQAIQDLGDGPGNRGQQETEDRHERRECRRDLQLVAACEDGGRDDLAEHEHEGNR
mmetsp:Transcript_85701/g.247493  ORF Transcript_85701/g.247493 Transcript_85701/m.247493 type:complete len:323 (-) Transcript_85701:408-1376(-)